MERAVAPTRKRPDDVPALHKQLPVIVAGKDARVLQQFQAFGGNTQRPSEEKCTNSVRNDDDWYERQERIVEKSAGVDRDLVEAKDEGHGGRHDRMETEKR